MVRISDKKNLYLSEEEYAIAEKNGISRANAYQRVYKYRKTNEKAITEPLTYVIKKGDNKWDKWKAIAESNGVCESTFRKRLIRGWMEEDACTRPPRKYGHKRKGDVDDKKAEEIK